MASADRLKLSPDTPLDKNYLKVAHKELREKPEHIDAHVQSLKRWLESNPHLKCSDDRRVYVAFLRHSKYEHSKAQTRIDNFITLRKSDKVDTHRWFERPTVDDPFLKEYLAMGIHVPVGFLQDGTLLFIIRFGNWRPDRLPQEKFCTFITMQIDRLIQDPRIQVCGVRILFDMTGATSEHMTAMNARKNGKELMRMFQEGYPIRTKSFIYYNEPAVMDVLLKIMTTWMKAKLKDRIIRCKGDIDKACKKISGLKDVLPWEYGGNNRSIKDIVAEQNADFIELYSGKTIWDGMEVDETKRPESAKSLLKEYKDVDDGLMGTPGTFLQLPKGD